MRGLAHRFRLTFGINLEQNAGGEIGVPVTAGKCYSSVTGTNSAKRA